MSSDLFIILDGRVSVEIELARGSDNIREQIVVLRKGDVFGKIAFLEGKRRSAYVVALDDIRVLKMKVKELNDKFTNNTGTGYLFMRNLAIILAHRLIDTNFMWRKDLGHIPS